MLSALRQFPWKTSEESYQKIPREEGSEKMHISNQQPQRRLLQLVLLRHVLIFLLGLSVGLATMLLLLASRGAPSHAPTRFPNSLIPSQVFTPKIPTSWVPDDRYIGFSAFSNIMWHRLVEKSVWIDDPKEHSLGAGFEGPFNHTSETMIPPQFYHISNLHQLHCLNIIRGRYFELQLDLPSLSKQSEIAARDTSYHMDHCIEYLRMTIMCGGSWNVESSSPPGTPPELRTDPFGHPIGWGGIRSCVNWDALMTWQKTQMGAYQQALSSLQ